MKLSRIALATSLVIGSAALVACDIKTTIANGTGIGAEKNQPPTITSFTANPTNTTNPSQAITFTLDVVDPDGDILKYSWTATGGVLNTNTGRSVLWTPPSEAGNYIIQVSISDQKGGSAEGSQNVTVKTDGTAKVGQ
ncbi:hypothetical protein D3C72_132310 [compost metagenome]